MPHFRYQKKLFLSYAGLLIIILLTIITFFAIYTVQTQTRKIQDNLHTISEKTMTELDYRLSDMNRITLYISANNQILEALSSAKEQKLTDFELYERTRDTLNAITTPISSIPYRISIFNESGNFIYTGVPLSQQKLSAHLAREDYRQWYDTLSSSIGNQIRTDIPAEDIYSDEEHMLTVYRNIYNSPFEGKVLGRLLATVEIQFRYSYLQEILNLDDVGINACLADRDGTIYYSSGPSYSHSLIQDIIRAHDGSVSATGIQDRFVYSTAYSQNTDWILILSESPASIFQSIVPIFIVMMILATALLILGLFYIMLISRRVTRPLKDLVSSIEKVSLHNFRLSVSSDQFTDEFEALNCSFDSMFHRLEQSMDELVALKAHNLRAQFNAMQAQISPHFLYNMFAVMKNMCRENNMDAISHSCDYLADMLRYITKFDNTAIASISEEIKYAENYLNLMKMRYEDMFSFEIDHPAPSRIDSVMVPKLILIPVVENSFQHGFKSVLPPWSIHIRCTVDEHGWKLYVRDNGCGISKKDQEHIFEEAARLSSAYENDTLAIGGLGLVNTLVRMKLYFKESYCFRIETPPQGGAEIILGGDFHVKDIISGG